MAIVIVPPNNPTITWAATLDPGHHSFSKWAILPHSLREIILQSVKASDTLGHQPDGYAMLMRPNKAVTAVHGCHCPSDMAVRMRKVLARSWVGVRVCHLLYYSDCLIKSFHVFLQVL